jgi:4-hydroxy-4-methyl-2-oxoglutarate aldolase
VSSSDDEALGRLSTATISDALDRLGLPGSAHGLAPLQDGQRMRGRAFTVRYVPAGAVPGTVGDYLDDVGPGAVIVLDNQGRTDCTVWGDILTAAAHAQGVAGTAISGVCRDTSRALASGYPIYSMGRFMRTGKDRVEVAEVSTPVARGEGVAG